MKRRIVFQDDELHLIKRGQVFHLYGTFDGKRVRESCKTTDLARAKDFLEKRRRELEGGWRVGYDSPDIEWVNVARSLYTRCKSGATHRGIPFALRVGHIHSLMRQTKYRCAVSGIPFSKTEIKFGARNPWAPSVDRIESRHGYTIENCRVVCIAANIALSDWGIDVLVRLSRGILRSSLLVDDDEPHQKLNKNDDTRKPLISIVK
jgi:hypothetical protein